MSKITVSEAIKCYPVTQSSLYRDMKKGVLSFEYNAKKVKVIDVSELQRVYGKPTKTETEKNESFTYIDSQSLSMREHENQQKIGALEKQVQELKEQIRIEKSEKTKIIDLADRLQRQTEILMLPKPPTPNLFQKIRHAFRNRNVLQKKRKIDTLENKQITSGVKKKRRRLQIHDKYVCPPNETTEK